MSSGRGEGPSAEREPFVETRAGGWFFVNAVLAGPTLLVLFPAAVRGLLRGIGAIGGPSRLLDPVPDLAARLGPYAGWLAVVPLITTLVNLRMALPAAARWTLRAFAVVHLGVLGWWALSVLR